MGTVTLVATLTGTRWDSGMSSQPASISSSAALGRLVVPREPLSAPEAISLKVPELLLRRQLGPSPFLCGK